MQEDSSLVILSPLFEATLDQILKWGDSSGAGELSCTETLALESLRQSIRSAVSRVAPGSLPPIDYASLLAEGRRMNQRWATHRWGGQLAINTAQRDLQGSILETCGRSPRDVSEADLWPLVWSLSGRHPDWRLDYDYEGHYLFKTAVTNTVNFLRHIEVPHVVEALSKIASRAGYQHVLEILSRSPFDGRSRVSGFDIDPRQYWKLERGWIIAPVMIVRRERGTPLHSWETRSALIRWARRMACLGYQDAPAAIEPFIKLFPPDATSG